jgi:hypothetical protein
MCDYSAERVASRAATKDDKLVSGHISDHTRGFRGEGDKIAVCLLPGTELAFAGPIQYDVPNFPHAPHGRFAKYDVARFVQINEDNPSTFHDALELPDGEIVLLQRLAQGQKATVLQLPAPKVREGDGGVLVIEGTGGIMPESGGLLEADLGGGIVFAQPPREIVRAG